jgi:hypothetical protein
MTSFVEINGARLAYAVSDNDESKPLFITLHGGRGFGMKAAIAVIQCADPFQVVMRATIKRIYHCVIDTECFLLTFEDTDRVLEQSHTRFTNWLKILKACDSTLLVQVTALFSVEAALVVTLPSNMR